MVCSGSVHLPPDIPNEGSSQYAEKGTAIHTFSEICLAENKQPEDLEGRVINGLTMDRSCVDIATVYVDFVRSLPGFKAYEVKVSLEEVIFDCYGTADCVSMTPGKLTVTDLKTGQGNRVDAEENTQLMCYALGAFLKFDCIYDFQEITLVIVQPPLEHISTWKIDRARLMVFADELREAYRRINEEPTFVLSEKGCQWCRSQAQCPEKRRVADEAAVVDFASFVKVEIDPQEMAKYMKLVPILKDFINAVENYAKDTLLAGKELPGFKVVEGRRTRAWTDESAVEKFLKEKGFAALIYSEPAMLSVAQMEKALKGEDVSLDGFVFAKEGSPTVVPDTDKRVAISRAATAAKDFANS
jgi:hypothetical protein